MPKSLSVAEGLLSCAIYETGENCAISLHENSNFLCYNTYVGFGICAGKEIRNVFECGVQVLYGVHGICTIIGIEKRLVDHKRVEYYILEPVDQPDARFYVPTQNEGAVAKLRRILSKEQIDSLLSSDEARRDSWIADENTRKLRYRELIHSGDRTALVSMVGTLIRHKKKQQAAGKKFHLCDENFLRDAQKLLSTEFSMVLQIPAEEVGNYIQSRICE